MSEIHSFEELQRQIFEYFDTPETLPNAYKLLEDSFSRYPEHAGLLYNWQFCAASLMDKPDLAIKIIKEALDSGYCWSEDYFRNDPDLVSLHNLPEFNRLAQVSEKLRLTAQLKIKPDLLTLVQPDSKEPTLPLLIALHGNTMTARISVNDWKSAVDLGWLTALPQSSQLFGPEMFVWDNMELGSREIEAHYRELIEKYSVDTNRVVISGFSKGGEMAIWFALKEIIPLSGFIAVNPGGQLIQKVQSWLPIIDECKNLTNLRGFFVVGEQDSGAANIKALYEILISRGMECKLFVQPGIGHDFPDQFNQVLRKAIEFIQHC